MLVAMPSPNGTNHEKLFIRASRRLLAAYDSAEGLSQPLAQQLLIFLRGKLGAADYAELETLLEGSDAPPAADARPRWRTKSTALSFDERYPGAARIKQVW